MATGTYIFQSLMWDGNFLYYFIAVRQISKFLSTKTSSDLLEHKCNYKCSESITTVYFNLVQVVKYSLFYLVFIRNVYRREISVTVLEMSFSYHVAKGLMKFSPDVHLNLYWNKFNIRLQITHYCVVEYLTLLHTCMYYCENIFFSWNTETSAS